MRRIGVSCPDARRSGLRCTHRGAFLQGLKESGLSWASNVRSIFAGPRSQSRHRSQVGADLVRTRAGRDPASGGSNCRHCTATRTVPIVFTPVTTRSAPALSTALPAGRQRHWLYELLYRHQRETAGAAHQFAPKPDAIGGPSGPRHRRRDRPVGRHPRRGAIARREVSPVGVRDAARSSAPLGHSRAGRMAA